MKLYYQILMNPKFTNNNNHIRLHFCSIVAGPLVRNDCNAIPNVLYSWSNI